ncbi:MAG: carbohydrate binding domain-containing protein [Planctomycetota bacterium]
MTRGTTRPTRTRAHGSVLVLVMGVSAIVGVIGLSSLLAVRMQHRDVDGRADATQAAILADGALRIVHARLSNDDDWRSAHTSGVWSAAETLGADAAMRYRLTDERDGDLADREDDPARLTVRIAHGDAVRLASIQIAGGATLGPELVANGGGESGNAGYGVTVVTGNVNVHNDNPRSGRNYLKLENRLSQIDAWKQDLPPDALESGKTYRVTAWMRVANDAVNVKIGLLQSRGLQISSTETSQASSTSWKQITADLTPNFTFDPTAVYVYGATALGNQDLDFDDLSVREVLVGSLPVVRGTYRRELDR